MKGCTPVFVQIPDSILNNISLHRADFGAFSASHTHFRVDMGHILMGKRNGAHGTFSNTDLTGDTLVRDYLGNFNAFVISMLLTRCAMALSPFHNRPL
jgi:hypothetical protein